jgi:hypothetical protein
MTPIVSIRTVLERGDMWHTSVFIHKAETGRRLGLTKAISHIMSTAVYQIPTTILGEIPAPGMTTAMWRIEVASSNSMTQI